MEHTGRCVAVSEPNSPILLAEKYRKCGDSSELRQLARDVIRWECRPYSTMQPPPLGYVLKLLRYCIVTLPMFRQSRRSVIWTNLLIFFFLLGQLLWTKKAELHKDDRAMCPIYGCPENFRESL